MPDHGTYVVCRQGGLRCREEERHLACDAPSRQQGVFFGGGSMGAGCVGAEAGSRWSARSEARTYDLDVDEDRRIVEHRELLQRLGHGVLPWMGGVGGCGRSGLAWVLEPWGSAT